MTNGSQKLKTIVDHFDSDAYVVKNSQHKLYLVTNFNAPNKKLVTVDANNPSQEHWKDLIPETEHVLNLNSGGGYFFAEYMVDAISKVFQYDFNGI